MRQMRVDNGCLNLGSIWAAGHLNLLLFSHSVVSDCDPMDCSMPGFPVLHHLLKLAQTQVHWDQWCHPTISSSVIRLLLLPSIYPSIRDFSNKSVLRIRWPKYWSFSLSLPMNLSFQLYSGLISFRMDWLDLHAVQRTLKSLLQHHSSKASILQHSAFSIVQLSHPYMTTGKTIALTRWTFVSKVRSLLFNMLSMLVITFLPRSKCLNFMALVTICSDFGAPQIKSVTVSIVSPSICHEVMGPDAMILVFWCWVLSQLFHSPFSLSPRGSLVLLHFLP